MIFKGFGIVWDSEKNKPLCQFEKNGTLETEDRETIDKLVILGYDYEGELPSDDNGFSEGDNENPEGDNENPEGDNENPEGDNENPEVKKGRAKKG